MIGSPRGTGIVQPHFASGFRRRNTVMASFRETERDGERDRERLCSTDTFALPNNTREEM